MTRLLIANRGEIAVRIAKAARANGIVALGVYSDADAHAAFLDAMDDALRIGGAPASESYLDGAHILEAARTLNADAVHPGYGFLSERGTFARSVEAAGLIFVGPSPDALEAMGDKIEAKRRVRDYGVPVVPGYDGEDQSAKSLRHEAKRIGLPVLIKASAGGGGRGMRVVEDFSTFEEALEAAKREALAAFGDATVLLERYVQRPRHIEFQILADAFGNTIHLGERECSIQRRHQKVVEEAPSVALNRELRAEMGNAAVRAARSVGYTNAGTVEFLLDEHGAFYFLEMNARLQVEHPVTEAVYGLDLVQWQLRIASGEPLTIAQTSVRPNGWAIEARITAENPQTGYLPASGTITGWEPPDGPGIRLDTGVRAGSNISIYYDSMIAKLIVWDDDRASAVARLTHALERFRIDGVPTNLPLLLRIARDPAFRDGALTTRFLEERPEFMRPTPAEEPDGAFLLAIGAALATPRAWRIGGVGIPITLRGQQRTVQVVASHRGSGNEWNVDGDLQADVAFTVDGGRVVATGASRYAGRASLHDDEVDVSLEGNTFRFALGDPPRLGTVTHSKSRRGHEAVIAPMPGKIVKVMVREGDDVAERDLLVVLEAMKMEHRIEAPHAGKVRRVEVAPGALVSSGAMLVEIG
ncbi:MAG: ATP-grasp domain-containing protein [Candidatus Eremiobacteraeota bacterium]|nr:ATP-grasp domain-containing protein [Candidatus Eremiobacteraeota bacterium]